MRRCLYLALLASLCLLLGCEQKLPDLDQFIENQKQQPAPKIEPFPEAKEYEPYHYEANQRRSPFQLGGSISSRTQVASVKPDLGRALEKLESFSLDSLNMVGTITKNNQRFALIEAPDHIVYRVSVGAHAGHNYGEITAITKNSIVLTEIVPNGHGGYQEQQAHIHLKDN